VQVSKETIQPHGGSLVNRILSPEKSKEKQKQAKSLPEIHLDAREMADLEMIGVGAMSPLKGFMSKADYTGVVEDMHLNSGEVWSLPITLSVDETKKNELSTGEEAVLIDQSNSKPVGIIEIDQIFEYDKEKEASNVFRTTLESHPGVTALYAQDDYLVGGNIWLFEEVKYDSFRHYRQSPAELRKLFVERGWETVVAFQTRNPIHRAHEYLQKCALELVDGLLIHPLVGETKSDDVPASVRMDCYETIIEYYYPKDRTQISVFPAAMRYAGPREAIFHALVRKNYGCTHFIVGRDHAGVGDFYGTYDAQLIFNEFTQEEIGITPMFFEHAFYCNTCGNMASNKTCPHPGEDRVFLSGTKVREKLSNGEDLPKEFTRPEVSAILKKAYSN
jgi:sulfate adenylyltransferase